MTGFMLIVTGILLLIITTVTVPTYFLIEYSCYKTYEGYNPKFGFFTGCLVKYNNKYISTDNFIIVDNLKNEH